MACGNVWPSSVGRCTGPQQPAAHSPPGLIVDSDPIHLLPGSEEALTVRMRVSSTTLLPAQQIDLVLRVRSMAHAGAQQDLPIEVTAPIVDVPVQLRAEPRLLRVRDTDTAKCTVVIDNSRSNRPMLLRFSGSDAEQAVRFDFDPPIVDIGPGASASVLLALTASQPDPGAELSRVELLVGSVGLYAQEHDGAQRRLGLVVRHPRTVVALGAPGSRTASIRPPAPQAWRWRRSACPGPWWTSTWACQL